MMEKNMKKNIYAYNWATLLYSRNQHNILNQLYFNNIFLKLKKIKSSRMSAASGTQKT